MKNIFYILLISMLVYSCGEKDEVNPVSPAPVDNGKDTVAYFYISGNGTGQVKAELILSNASKTIVFDTIINYTTHAENDSLGILLNLKGIPQTGIFDMELNLYFNNSKVSSSGSPSAKQIKFFPSEDFGGMMPVGYITPNCGILGAYRQNF